MKQKSTASRNAKITSILAKCIKTALFPIGSFKRATILSILAETLVPIATVPAGNKILKFWGFGGWPLYRGRSVLEKEPLTIKWIDSFEHGSTFWDIGANIGVFTVYAAITKDTDTYAFEPSAANMAVLCKNIEINKIDNIVTALPLAFTDATKIDHLNMISTAPGNTGGQFRETSYRKNNIFKQSCLGFSVDGFIEAYNLSVPNYIKIDVDGIELTILENADKTLGNKTLKSVILEADTTSEEYTNIKTLLGKYAFKESESEPTVKGREQPRNLVFRKK